MDPPVRLFSDILERAVEAGSEIRNLDVRFLSILQYYPPAGAVEKQETDKKRGRIPGIHNIEMEYLIQVIFLRKLHTILTEIYFSVPGLNRLILSP